MNQSLSLFFKSRFATLRFRKRLFSRMKITSHAAKISETSAHFHRRNRKLKSRFATVSSALTSSAAFPDGDRRRDSSATTANIRRAFGPPMPSPYRPPAPSLNSACAIPHSRFGGVRADILFADKSGGSIAPPLRLAHDKIPPATSVKAFDSSAVGYKCVGWGILIAFFRRGTTEELRLHDLGNYKLRELEESTDASLSE